MASLTCLNSKMLLQAHTFAGPLAQVTLRIRTRQRSNCWVDCSGSDVCRKQLPTLFVNLLSIVSRTACKTETMFHSSNKLGDARELLYLVTERSHHVANGFLNVQTFLKTSIAQNSIHNWYRYKSGISIVSRTACNT